MGKNAGLHFLPSRRCQRKPKGKSLLLFPVALLATAGRAWQVYCCPTSTIMKESGFIFGRREAAPGVGGSASAVGM